MQLPTAAIALLLVCPTLWAHDSKSVCGLLSESELNAIAGESVHAAKQQPSLAAGRSQDCSYLGERTKLTMSVVRADTESVATQEFTSALGRAPGPKQSDEPLRGVGVEARYRPYANKDGGTIVVRYGTVVLVLSGSLERTALVQLARATAAHL